MRVIITSALLGLAIGGCGPLSKSIHDAKMEVAPQLQEESVARIKEVQSRLGKEKISAGCNNAYARSPIAIARTRIATEWRPSVSHTCVVINGPFSQIVGLKPLEAAYIANAGHKYDFSDEETAHLVSCVVSIDKDGTPSFRQGPTKADVHHNCHALRYLPR